MWRKYKIATPVFLGQDLNRLKEKLKMAKSNGADLIELRADSYSKIKESDLYKVKYLLKELKIPAIFTLRSKREGGKYHFSFERKLRLIKKAIDLNFDYVDIELKFLEKLKKNILDLKRNSKTKIILSYHNLKEAEPIDELRKIKNKMLDLKADILKIVVFSKNKSTNQDILQLIRETKKEGRDIIGIAMGKKGKETRIKGLLEGGYLGYFGLNEKEKTAPGQLSLTELKNVS